MYLDSNWNDCRSVRYSRILSAGCHSYIVGRPRYICQNPSYRNEVCHTGMKFIPILIALLLTRSYIRLPNFAGSQHHTMVAACSYLIRNVGYEGMFRGINPTLISVVPYSAVQFAAFNMVSTALTRAKGIAEGSVEVGRKPDAIVSSSSGLIAGALAKGLTHPLDVVKKRFGTDYICYIILNLSVYHNDVFGV